MLGLLGPGEGGNTGQNTVNVWWTVGIFSLVILLLENLTIFINVRHTINL